jgi:hypothetical protein
MSGVENPDGDTAWSASLPAERKPGASGAQACNSSAAEANKVACSRKRFKPDSAS